MRANAYYGEPKGSKVIFHAGVRTRLCSSMKLHVRAQIGHAGAQSLCSGTKSLC